MISGVEFITLLSRKMVGSSEFVSSKGRCLYAGYLSSGTIKRKTNTKTDVGVGAHYIFRAKKYKIKF